MIDVKAAWQRVFDGNPEELVLIHGPADRAVSRGKLREMAFRCGKALAASGVKGGDEVVVMLPNSLEMIYWLLGIWQKGCVFIPVDPEKTEREIADMLEQVSPALILCREEDVQRCDRFGKTFPLSLPMGETDLPPGNPSETEVSRGMADLLAGDQVCMITFSSGTTGRPKGVKHSLTNLLLSAGALGSAFGFDTSKVFYHNLPMSYMAGILNALLVPLLFGAKVVIGPKYQVSEVFSFWEYPVRYGVNVFWLIPAMVSMLLKLDRGSTGIEYARRQGNVIGCVATAPLDSHQKRQFEEKYAISLYESYGLSETLFNITNLPDRESAEGSVGYILEGVAVTLAADNEIVIQVPWMCKGYTDPEVAIPLTEDGFWTGDLGRIDERGRVFVTGRKKDLIIRGGVNISPRRIEDFLSARVEWAEFTVVGLPDGVLGEKTVCFYAQEGAEQPEVLKGLSRDIGEVLGKDHTVDGFIHLSAIPRNSNGKMDKKMLRQEYGAAKS